MAKITKEQYKLVEDNYNLVYFAVNKVLSSGYYSLQDDYDDLVQVASLALCKAAIKYDPSISAFSTYATTAIINALRKHAKEETQTISVYNSDSFDYTEEDDISVEQKNFDVVCPERFELNDGSELEQILTRIAESYTGISKNGVYCIMYMANGYTVSDLARKYKTTTNNITAWISRARTKLKDHPDLLAFCNVA